MKYSKKKVKFRKSLSKKGLKRKNDCDIELPENISKCGAVGIGDSKLTNGVPYKFQILHIKGTKGTEGF